MMHSSHKTRPAGILKIPEVIPDGTEVAQSACSVLMLSVRGATYPLNDITALTNTENDMKGFLRSQVLLETCLSSSKRP